MDPLQLRRLVIVPALRRVALWSEDAEELVYLTGAVESGYRYIRQLGSGPALGFWQMEPATHDDILANWLDYQSGTLPQLVVGLLARDLKPRSRQLVGNLEYACVMARLQYRRRPEPLPKAGNLEGQAAYWKAHYNTVAGKGTVEKFMVKARRFL